jgi:hypothetical protein
VTNSRGVKPSEEILSEQTPVALDAAVAWIRHHALANGLGPLLRVDPLKVTRRSIVLRVVTSSSTALYFKAGLGLAHLEAPLTAFLSRRHPAHFTPVLAFDAAHGWMLTKDVGGVALMSATDSIRWSRALETLGRIQCEFSDGIDALFELGCRQKTMAGLRHQIDGFVDEWCANGGDSPAERARVQRAAPVWKDMCDRKWPGLPEATLDHIDLHPRNILITRGGPVFLDWDAGGIGHPFWAPLILIGYGERMIPRVAAMRVELRTAYLRPWTTRLPMTRLVEAFEHARPLASLKYALGLAYGWRAEGASPEGEKLRMTIRACLDTALQLDTVSQKEQL